MHHHNLMRTLGSLIAASVCAFGALTSAASADPSRYATAEEQPHVQMAPGNGGNLALLSPDDVVLTNLSLGRLAGTQPSSTYGIRADGTNSGAGFDTPGSYKPGPGCSIQCIKAGVAYARGVDAELRVWTDTPANIVIIVWDNAGYYRSFGSGPGYTYFSGFFDDLQPGTKYFAEAFATDGEGYTSSGDGSFTTLTRNVEISFNAADIGKRPYGQDPFGWVAWANTKDQSGDPFNWPLENGGYLNEPVFPVDADGDQLLLGFQSFQLQDVRQVLGFGVMVWQSNEGPDICGAWALPSEPYAFGTASCTTWATASLAFPEMDLDNRPANATSWTEHSFQLTATVPGSFDLEFSVPVILHVTYE